MLFSKRDHYKLKGHREIHVITVLDVGFQCVICKVEYHDGIVGERKFSNLELTDLLVKY